MPVYGIEHAVGQPDDGVQVAFGEQRFLDAGLHALAEERAVGQHERGAAAWLENAHEEHEEQVGRLAGAELAWKVGFDAVFFHAAERRVGDDHIDALLRLPVTQRARQRVVVADVGRNVDAVQQQVGHAEQVRQVLLLDAGEALLNGCSSSSRLGLLAEVLDGADVGSRRCRRRVEDRSRPSADLTWSTMNCVTARGV